MYVCAGMVHAGIVTFEASTTLAMIGYFQGKKGYDFDILGAESCLVDDNANQIIKKAQNVKCDYLFFLDTDLQFLGPGDIVGYMMELDKDVLCGVYYQGLFPHRPVLYKFTEDDKIKNFYHVPKDLCRVGASGAGFMLIKKRVLDLFTDEKNEELGNPFDPVMKGKCVHLRADAAFFWRLQKLGVEVWAQPMIPLAHIKKAVITASHFEASRDVLETNEKSTSNNG